MIPRFWYQKLQKIIHTPPQKGFTLIELLLVVVIAAVLSAIALPSFLNQANKARQSEAKTYIGAINRSQQAYRLENSTFAHEISDLGVGIPTQTAFYSYSIGQIPVSYIATYSTATPRMSALKGYIGAVQITMARSDQATAVTILCDSGGVGTNTPTPTLLNNYDPNNVTQDDLTCNN